MPQTSMHAAGRLNSRSVRDHNLSLVLHELHRRFSGSRSLICSATGLTPGAVTLLVNELMKAGFIETGGMLEAEGGRRKKQLVLSGRTYPVAVLLLRHESVRLVCESFSGERLVDEVYERDFRGRPVEDFVSFAAELIYTLERRLAKERGLELKAVGVVSPIAVLAHQTGTLPNADFGWPMMDIGASIRSEVERLGGAPTVVMMNDANCAGWAEYRALVQAGAEDPHGVIFIDTDDPMGGSFIFDGKVYNGALGTAMGIGHIQINAEGERCVCGKRGCLTLYAGRDALMRRSGLTELVNTSGPDTALAELERRAKMGEEPARETLDRAVRYVRIAIENALTLLVADCVIIGGYMGAHLDDILAVDNGFTSLGVPGVTSLHAAVLGDEAAVTGGLSRMRGAVIDHVGEIIRGETLDPSTLLQDTV